MLRHLSRRPLTLRAVAILLALLVALAACGDEDDSGDDASADGAADAADGEFPRTVDHALGSTEMETAPERIVALDMSLVDAVLALDLDLIGYTTYSDPNGPLPEHFGAAVEDHAEGAEWVGDLTSPNLELIATLEPDLIVTAAVRHEGIYDQLAAIAPTVASESAGGGWKETLRLVGEATGHRDRADELIAGYENRAATVGGAINEAAGDPTISIVRFLDAIRLYQPVSFSGTVLADAGLARPGSQQNAEDFITVISEEELALAEADVLFFTVYDNEDIADYVAELHSRPLWTSLDVVSRGDAHPVPDDTWMSGVGIFGAHIILDDLAETFGVDANPVPSEEQP